MLLVINFLFIRLVLQVSPPSLKAFLQHFVRICFPPFLSNRLRVPIFNLAGTSRLTRWWKSWVKGQSAATHLSVTDLDCQIWTRLYNLNPLRPHTHTCTHSLQSVHWTFYLWRLHADCFREHNDSQKNPAQTGENTYWKKNICFQRNSLFTGLVFDCNLD